MPYSMLTRQKQKAIWVGRLNWGWNKCAVMAGAGRQISLVTRKNSQRQRFFTIIKFRLGYFLSNMLCQQDNLLFLESYRKYAD